jgi:hypothetical protein
MIGVVHPGPGSRIRIHNTATLPKSFTCMPFLPLTLTKKIIRAIMRPKPKSALLSEFFYTPLSPVIETHCGFRGFGDTLKLKI